MKKVAKRKSNEEKNIENLEGDMHSTTFSDISPPISIYLYIYYLSLSLSQAEHRTEARQAISLPLKTMSTPY